MNKRHFFTSLVLASLVLFTSVGFAVARQESVDQQVFNTFKALSKAEAAGGNVSSLVADFNEAIEVLERGERTGNSSLVEEARPRLNMISASAPVVAQEGAAANQIRILYTAVSLGLLAAVGFVVYLYVPKLFWRLWIRSKKNWRIKA